MTTALDLMLAYGCTAKEAVELLECESDFAIAVRSIGPLLAYRSPMGWTLKGKPAFRGAFIRYAERAA